MSFGQDVLNAHDPAYMTQYYAGMHAQNDAYFERMAALNEIKRRRQEEEAEQARLWNERQKWRPSAAEANPPESFDAYHASRAADMRTIAATKPTPEQIWGDELTGGPMGPTEFQSLQDRLIGGGGDSGASKFPPSMLGGSDPGGGPEVTRAMHLERAPAAMFKDGGSPVVTLGGTPHVRDAAYLASGTPMGAMSDALSGITDDAMLSGLGFDPAPPQNPQGTLVSGAIGHGVQRLAATVDALPDNHPEKAAYSSVVDQLKSGNIHALPKALQQPQQQPQVSESLGNAIQAHKDKKAKDFAQALAMYDEMHTSGKYDFTQLANYFKSIQQKFPDLVAGHVRGMTSSQIQKTVQNVEDELVRHSIAKIGMPPELYLGKDPKGKDRWAMTPAEWVALQREQATAGHQQFGEQHAVNQAQEKHNMGLFAAEMKMYQGMIPKPLPEGANAKAHAAHAKQMRLAMEGMADVQARMTTGGTPHAATISQDYLDAQAEQGQAQGTAAEQAAAQKQGNVEVTQVHSRRLQLGATPRQVRLSAVQHQDTVTDPMAAEMHAARIKQITSARNAERGQARNGQGWRHHETGTTKAVGREVQGDD
jgi:hypothetical protein